MMRKLFISATAMFWLVVALFWAAYVWRPNEAAAPDPVPAQKSWTLVEIARHDTAKDCWMAIDGAVYDLTAYLPQHPSSPTVILSWCGKEATEAYQTKTKGRPHSSRADQLLSTFLIGRLPRP